MSGYLNRKRVQCRNTHSNQAQVSRCLLFRHVHYPFADSVVFLHLMKQVDSLVIGVPFEGDSCNTQAQHKHACVDKLLPVCKFQGCNQSKSDLLEVSSSACPWGLMARAHTFCFCLSLCPMTLSGTCLVAAYPAVPYLVSSYQPYWHLHVSRLYLLGMQLVT